MSVFKEINMQADIIKVISAFIDVKRKGKGYVAICPFHSDTHPSLHIDPNKQIYKCFSCNAGGTTIKFVKEFSNISFLNAAKKVVEICGLNISFDVSKNDRPNIQSPLYKIINDALLFYSYALINAPEAKAFQWLLTRSVSQQTITKFKLGWASSHPTALKEYLLKKNHNINDLLKSRLVTVNQYDKITDFFSGRILYPIFDQYGQVVAFTGRTIDNREPKYLSLQDSVIYHKGSCLYNFHYLLKNNIKDVILVEGMHDVFALDAKGINNVVALMGTSITNEQVKLLNKFKSITLLLDPDQAGQTATEKIKNIFQSQDIEIRIPITKLTKDPDDFFSSLDANKVKEFVNNYSVLKKNISVHNTFHENSVFTSKKTSIQSAMPMKKLHAAEELLITNMILDPSKTMDFYFKKKGQVIAGVVREVTDYLLFLYLVNQEQNENFQLLKNAYMLLSLQAQAVLKKLANVDEKIKKCSDASWEQLLHQIKLWYQKNKLISKKK